MILLNLALGLVTATVLFMLDTIARDLAMDSIALPLTGLLVGAVMAGLFLPSLLSRLFHQRSAASLWQGRAVLVVATVIMAGSTWTLFSGPDVLKVHPEAAMRQLVRGCVWGLGLLGCWLSIRRGSPGLETATSK